MSLRISLLLVISLLAAPARADVTVFYAPPGPPAPLVAEVVPNPEDAEADRALAAVPEPVPVLDPEPAPAATSVPEPEPEPVPVPALALAHSPSSPPSPTSLIRFIRIGDGSRDEVTLPLLDAEGRPDPASLRELSLLSRPRDAEMPSPADLAAHADDLEWVAADIRRLHPGLLTRLAQVAGRFPGRAIEIVSGYRPDARDGSRHLSGRALDLRVVSVSVDELDAFLRTLPETGVGLYPTSDFIHVDVRSRSAHWTDVSGPGEPARRVRDAAVAPAVGGASEPVVPAPVVAAPARSTRSRPTEERRELDGLDAEAIAREITSRMGDLDLSL